MKTTQIHHRSLGRRILSAWQLYVLLLPALVFFGVFRYAPLYGIQIAFRDYMPNLGIWGSRWIGLDNFERFFNGFNFESLLSNTIILAVLQLIVNFPIPIILALVMNYIKNQRFKHATQLIVYAPYFISTVVLVGMLNVFFSLDGLVNQIIQHLGGDPILFLNMESAFRPMYVLSDVWQTMGWNSIIYLAALSGVSPELHEAALVDGANKFQRVFHIDIPHILPTVVIMLILNIGMIMSLGFEKAYLMQNDLNLGKSEIIATYVYKVGLIQGQYGFSTAVDIFNSVINLILLLSVNKISAKVSGSSLW